MKLYMLKQQVTKLNQTKELKGSLLRCKIELMAHSIAIWMIFSFVHIHPLTTKNKKNNIEN